MQLASSNRRRSRFPILFGVIGLVYAITLLGPFRGIPWNVHAPENQPVGQLTVLMAAANGTLPYVRPPYPQSGGNFDRCGNFDGSNTDQSGETIMRKFAQTNNEAIHDSEKITMISAQRSETMAANARLVTMVDQQGKLVYRVYAVQEFSGRGYTGVVMSRETFGELMELVNRQLVKGGLTRGPPTFNTLMSNVIPKFIEIADERGLGNVYKHDMDFTGAMNWMNWHNLDCRNVPLL